MEKYSAYRDPGTGIQPFLTPVSPPGYDLLVTVSLPFGYILGAVRTLFVVVLGLVYLVLVPGVCLVLAPIPPIYRLIARAFTSVITRLILLLLGIAWLSVEHVTRKRGKGPKHTEVWNPRAGDIIVSNWVSWVEILWLAFRFDPIFVLPVSNTNVASPSSNRNTPVTRNKTGRHTGTGSAALSSPNRASRDRLPILGFRQVSFLSAILVTGRVPPYTTTGQPQSTPLEVIRKNANRPIVVFPECTTSNGRGLLRFAPVFQNENSLPVKNYNVYVMCVRYDPPTALSPTVTHSIPSPILNPLPHLFRLTTAFQPPSVSIRLLAPSESPSSPLFMVNEVVTGHGAGEDQLSEICATLIAQIGKLKKTGMGWEDKAEFLEFYNRKRYSSP